MESPAPGPPCKASPVGQAVALDEPATAVLAPTALLAPHAGPMPRKGTTFRWGAPGSGGAVVVDRSATPKFNSRGLPARPTWPTA